MKKMKLIGLCVFFSINLLAQESDSLETRKAQITLAYPIGSSGSNSMKYSNNFSFNILVGLNGGLKGAEIGSILNYNNGKVKGFQLSGVSNINTRQSKGFLLSGVSNICLASATGVFMSGGMNYASLKTKGFQLAPINIAASDYSGLQLGVINYAKNHKGIQFGVINIVQDGDNGVPVGLINIVKNGLFEFELTGGEVMYSNFNYKMGVDKLYTVYKIGYSSYKNNAVYSLGFGFGSNLYSTDKQTISVDISSNHIVYDNDWNKNLNLLNKVDLNYKRKISDNFSLLIGPSFNIYNMKEKVGGELGTLNMPYTIHESGNADSKMSMWVGANIGLSYRL
jgi:hypothetical protein